MGKFISDVIGEEFKEWKRGDIIILAAPTGCGKSTFVLEKLLPYAAERDEKVLYLVNRKILKEQIVERIEEKESVREQLCIKVSTYQHLEEQYSKMVASNNEEYLKEFRGFTYIIADECHYFSLDALYNTRTELSYRWIKNCTRSIVVYISATMENVESRIREDFDNLKYEATNIYEKELLNECFNGRVDRMQSMVGAYGINLFSNLHERIVRKYQMPNNNCEHIEVNYVASIEELCDLMKRINEKWLVFVDSKDKGREMEKKISKGANKNECLFIDAHFRRDEDASEEVERIAENSYYKSRVLIVTPVLDNGVSLIDNQLRNIVIMTDMKDSFFQMLGRKRGTNQKINLYLMSLTVREIRERYRFYDKLRAICNECEKEREKAFGTIKGLPSLEQYQITSMQEVWNGLERTSEGKCESDYKEKYLCYANQIEYSAVLTQSHFFLRKAFENEWKYYLKFCYLYGGYILLNDFALSRIKMSYRFYKELYDLNNDKEAYELDENLVMTQMRWLNKTEREMREIISCGKVDETERALVRVKEVFDRIVGVKIKKEEYKKTVLDINKSFYDNLDFLLRQLTLSGDEKKYLDLVQKKRELSKPFVDFLCAHYSKLNYRQLVRDGKYCLMQIESGEE